MRAARVRLLLILSIALPTGLFATTAGAAPDPAAELVAATNASRAAEGLAPLEVDGQLADVARRQSERMAAEGRLYHNPALTTEVADWLVVGENVGVGPSASAMHEEFMQSPMHRDNLLESRYTQIGVAIVEVEGRLWATQVFRQPVAQQAPPAPEVATPPAPAASATPTPTPAAASTPVAAPVVAPAPSPAPAAATTPPLEDAAPPASEPEHVVASLQPATPAAVSDERICVPVRGAIACVTLHLVVERTGGISATV